MYLEHYQKTSDLTSGFCLTLANKGAVDCEVVEWRRRRITAFDFTFDEELFQSHIFFGWQHPFKRGTTLILKRHPDFDVSSPHEALCFPLQSIKKLWHERRKETALLEQGLQKKLSSYPSFLRVLPMFLMFGDLTAVFLETTQEHTSTRVHPRGIVCSRETTTGPVRRHLLVGLTHCPGTPQA